LALPNNEAFKIIAEIKKNELNKKIRIVILTQNEQIGEEARALRCGAGDYVMKPFSPAGYGHGYMYNWKFCVSSSIQTLR